MLANHRVTDLLARTHWEVGGSRSVLAITIPRAEGIQGTRYVDRPSQSDRCVTRAHGSCPQQRTSAAAESPATTTSMAFQQLTEQGDEDKRPYAESGFQARLTVARYSAPVIRGAVLVPQETRPGGNDGARGACRIASYIPFARFPFHRGCTLLSSGPTADRQTVLPFCFLFFFCLSVLSLRAKLPKGDVLQTAAAISRRSCVRRKGVYLGVCVCACPAKEMSLCACRASSGSSARIERASRERMGGRYTRRWEEEEEEQEEEKPLSEAREEQTERYDVILFHLLSALARRAGRLVPRGV